MRRKPTPVRSWLIWFGLFIGFGVVLGIVIGLALTPFLKGLNS